MGSRLVWEAGGEVVGELREGAAATVGVSEVAESAVSRARVPGTSKSPSRLRASQGYRKE
jgi:hypothetical protein